MFSGKNKRQKGGRWFRLEGGVAGRRGRSLAGLGRGGFGWEQRSGQGLGWKNGATGTEIRRLWKRGSQGSERANGGLLYAGIPLLPLQLALMATVPLGLGIREASSETGGKRCGELRQQRSGSRSCVSFRQGRSREIATWRGSSGISAGRELCGVKEQRRKM